MEIRPAHENDIPAIVELLKLSLGESLMPKSEAFWRWKHIDNPFGKSPVLVAEEGGKLIGVRAFMRWEWRQGDKLYKAVRAVDTATHPQHQGKGIFKKLTLQLVDQCKADGVDFIFNTPNTSSKPGYLKMGWEEYGKMRISVRPVFGMGKNDSEVDPQRLLRKEDEEVWKKFAAILSHSQSEHISTNRSVDFLHWRYATNPNISYQHLVSEDEAIIYRIKPGRFIKELRICEYLFTSPQTDSGFRALLLRTARAQGANLITYAGVRAPFLAPRLRIGPVITLRKLTTNNSLSFGLWRPSLGDMEVF